MKRKLIAILLCMAMMVGFLPALSMTASASEKIYINYENFPDARVRTFLIEQLLKGMLKEDSHGIYALASDVEAIEEIDIRNRNIGSLKGIEFFTGLKTLLCANNLLTSLDVSKNTKLEHLDCFNNHLTCLDLTKNINLYEIDCAYQFASAKYLFLNGVYYLDMRALVGINNLSNLKFTPAIDYNEETGIARFTKKLDSITYYYYPNGVLDDWVEMNVIVYLSRGYVDRSLAAPVETYSDADDYFAAAGITVAGLEDGESLVSGQTFTVNSEMACVSAISFDGGLTYNELTATKVDGENTYSFTLPELTGDFVIGIVLKGDVNGDGKVNAADALRIQRHITNDPDAPYESNFKLGALALLAEDATAEGIANSIDALRIQRYATNDPDDPYATGSWELRWIVKEE